MFGLNHRQQVQELRVSGFLEPVAADFPGAVRVPRGDPVNHLLALFFDAHGYVAWFQGRRSFYPCADCQ
ncbi:MAG TPA: hypothetical protein EYM58_00170 [Rhodospirillales bacterium]|nr:hypothetical protein [Rhodospirillales bacterium]